MSPERVLLTTFRFLEGANHPSIDSKTRIKEMTGTQRTLSKALSTYWVESDEVAFRGR